MKRCLFSFPALLLLLLGLLLCLNGCTPAAPQETPGGEETPPAPPMDENVTHVTELKDFTIVRDEMGAAAEKKAAVALKNLMENGCGVAGITTDWVESVGKEIIIGDTTRPESAAARQWALSQVAEGDAWYYVGVAENGNIVLTGSDDLSISAAVRSFMKQYRQQILEGAVTLPNDAVSVYQSGRPTLVTTEQGSDGEKSVFVAEIHLGAAPYFLDAGDGEDVTDLLRAAIQSVADLGGGVVYLPAGEYRVSDTLTIPSHVTLRGDYIDPDKGDCTKGTLLIVDERMSKNKNVIALSQAAAVQGLTFFYEGQSISSPVEYAATLAGINANGCWEICDCTLINSYDGISNGEPNANGMVTVDGVKGTVLHTGFYIQNRADISICTDLSFSPTYWASLSAEWNAPAEEEIRALMHEIDSIGMYLGDCDRDTNENILLDGFATGMYNREMNRSGVSGSYHNLTILGARVGIEAYGVDTRYGWLFSNATIEASEAAVLNKTPSDSAFCLIHLLNSTLTGSVSDGVHVYSSEGGADDTAYECPNRTAPLPGETLFDLADYGADNTGTVDVSSALQAAFDDAEAAGGGIVYLRPGRYLLEKPVEIKGDRVQLLGTNFSTNTRSTSLSTGSVLLVTWGRGGSADDVAAITVSGAYSGVTGISVIYPENGVKSAVGEAELPVEYSYFMRATGKQTYLNFVCMVAVSRAVHFDGASGFLCDRLLMTVYDQGVRATNCYGGLVTRLHTNGTYHTMGKECCAVLGDDWLYNGAEVYHIIDDIICKRLTLVQAWDCSELVLDQVFHYGAKLYLEAGDSDIVVVNGEGARATEQTTILRGGVELKMINYIRYYNPNHQLLEGENMVYLYNFDPAHTEVKVQIFEP